MDADLKEYEDKERRNNDAMTAKLLDKWNGLSSGSLAATIEDEIEIFESSRLITLI